MLPLSATQVQEYTESHTQICKPQNLDVWLLSIPKLSAELEIYESVLSPAEREAAARFRFDADRERSIAARGGLRWILSSYCRVSPRALTFQTAKHGKPSLLHVPLAPEFNVSHSGDYVLIGVTTGVPCGVDIERSNDRISEDAIARRFFSPGEVEWLARTDRGFLRLWTMKEALIKAVGHGLSIPLSDVDVTDVAEGNTCLMTIETPGIKKQTLWLNELETVEDYAAAVSVVDSTCTVNLVLT